MQDNRLEFPSGSYRSIAVRAFDPARQKLGDMVAAPTGPHQPDVPMLSKFEDGVEAFFANDMPTASLCL